MREQAPEADIVGPWPEWMKPGTAARYVDMAPRTFRKWFRGEKVNGRIRRADLDALMQRDRNHRLGRVA